MHHLVDHLITHGNNCPEKILWDFGSFSADPCHGAAPSSTNTEQCCSPGWLRGGDDDDVPSPVFVVCPFHAALEFTF